MYEIRQKVINKTGQTIQDGTAVYLNPEKWYHRLLNIKRKIVGITNLKR